MTTRTGFFLHPDSSLHDPGWGHPEHQGRLPALANALGADLLTLHGRVEQCEADSVGRDELLLAHSPEHVTIVQGACQRAGKGSVVALDPNTCVSAGSWLAAIGAVGAVISAAKEVATGAMANAFVAARPPGHHATRGHAMGFCLFNNVAVATRWLQTQGLAERVLIIDWDVHHGNGTQEIFQSDPSVFFLSLHQSPHYPYTGAVEETGTGRGVGYTLNVPLPAHTPAETYLEHFELALGKALEALTPDFIFVSAGFDVMAGDPLGGMLLEPEHLARMTERVMAVAEDSCGGKVVVVLEGGYAPRRLAAGAVAVMRSLAGVVGRR